MSENRDEDNNWLIFLVIIVPIVYEMSQRRRNNGRQRTWKFRTYLYTLITIGSLFAFLNCWIGYGDPDVPFVLTVFFGIMARVSFNTGGQYSANDLRQLAKRYQNGELTAEQFEEKRRNLIKQKWIGERPELRLQTLANLYDEGLITSEEYYFKKDQSEAMNEAGSLGSLIGSR